MTCLLMANRLLSAAQELLITWNFTTKSAPGFIEDGEKKKKKVFRQKQLSGQKHTDDVRGQ